MSAEPLPEENANVSEGAEATTSAANALPEGVDDVFVRQVKENVQRLLLSDDLELPRVSSIASRIMQIARDPNINVDRIVELVQADAFLAGQLLALVNSAFFALRQEVTSVRHAIVLLGLRAVGDLIFCVSLKMKVFNSKTYQNLMSNLWAHSIATGVGTEVLSQRFAGGRPGFMPGLFHDIGKAAILASIVTTESERRPNNPIGEAAAITLMEQLHRQVGVLLVRKWKLAPEIEECVKSHETFGKGMSDIAKLVYCSNRIAHHLGLGYKKIPLVLDQDPAFVSLGITDAETLKPILDQVSEHAARLSRTL